MSACFSGKGLQHPSFARRCLERRHSLSCFREASRSAAAVKLRATRGERQSHLKLLSLLCCCAAAVGDGSSDRPSTMMLLLPRNHAVKGGSGREEAYHGLASRGKRERESHGKIGCFCDQTRHESSRKEQQHKTTQEEERMWKKRTKRQDNKGGTRCRVKRREERKERSAGLSIREPQDAPQTVSFSFPILSSRLLPLMHVAVEERERKVAQLLPQHRSNIIDDDGRGTR